MKYCPTCKKIIATDAQICDSCSKSLTDISAESVVTVATVKGRSVSFIENALKDEGVPCHFAKTDGNIYNDLNAKVNAESDFSLLVPFEYYNKAFNVCLGIGVVEPEDRLVEETEVSDDTTTKTYEEKFEEKNGVKHRTWQMIWMIIFIVAGCLIIWGIDFIAEFIKSFFI